MPEDGPSEADPSAQPLERSVSQHSAASARSRRSSARHASKTQHMPSQPSSSASSIAASDKSLTSFPSFSPESPAVDRFDESQPKPDDRRASSPSARAPSIVDSLAAPTSARDALFEDPPLRQSFPGALHRADDGHIERLVARHGPVAVVRQIAEDLAQRDDKIANLRRRTDERERALRRIIRECGLTNLDIESRLRAVEKEMRATDRPQAADGRLLSHLMSDAMRDTVLESAYGETDRADSTIRANSASLSTSTAPENKKSTTRGWKGYFWGAGTFKKMGRTPNANSHGSSQANTTVLRSSSGMERRPTLQENLFDPPSSAGRGSETHVTTSRVSSIHSTGTSEHKPSVSLASLALRLVAGSTAPPGDADARGRTASAPGRATSARSSSKTSTKTVPSSRPTSVNSDPKALMAMRGSQMASRRAPSHAKSQLSEARGLKPAIAASGHAAAPPQENYGPVEMDAILPPGSQPPTLTMRNTYATDEYLTDRFGFIYDQRRKKRQREAAQTIQHMRSGSRAEMLMNGLSVKPSNLPHDAYSGTASTSSDSRPQSPGSAEEPAERRGPEEGRMKRWHDYLMIATFPTELLSHTPSINTPALVVMEGANPSSANEVVRSPAITPTFFVLVPPASTTTAVNSVAAGQPSETGITTGTVGKEDAEPVRFLKQLSDMHDALQRDKTVKWNDFLRKVRAERRREGEAAAAAAAAAAEARCEVPAMILPETRVADGEMIGISDLGNKGKVGRAKWHEFKALVLAGIPVAQRSKIWSECSGANGLRVPGVYEGLVSQAGDDDDPNVVGQIRMDIHRTLTDNIFFRKGPGVQKLSELLLAYSRRNKEVGYCQGMNLIAANLLLMMPTAEDAFWVMASMIENILPEGYYDHLLMPSRADQQVLRQYVSTVLPKLSAHLDTLSIELEALTFQWFLSVFTDCLCAEALFRVWDVVLCTNDGSTFLFQVALALLKLNETNLLLCDTPAEVYTYINHQMTEHAISIDGLLQASEGLRRVVRRDEVERRRAKAMQADRYLMMQRNGGYGVATTPMWRK